jgi:hypothetical protein
MGKRVIHVSATAALDVFRLVVRPSNFYSIPPVRFGYPTSETAASRNLEKSAPLESIATSYSDAVRPGTKI